MVSRFGALIPVRQHITDIDRDRPRPGSEMVGAAFVTTDEQAEAAVRCHLYVAVGEH